MNRKKLYESYKENNKLNKKYNKKIIVQKKSNFSKLLSFLLNLFQIIIKVIFYLAVIILCSIGATYVFNNIVLNFI